MAKKNDLKPKAYAKNAIDRWSHLTGYELEMLSSEYYTKDQIRSLASKYGVKNYSKYKSSEELAEAVRNTELYIEAGNQTRKTLFEIIREKTKGKSRSVTWYRQEFGKLQAKIKVEPYRMTIDQKMDSIQNIVHQDQNEIRRSPIPGHLYFYKYDAITPYNSLPFFDKYPLTFVLRNDGSYFYGFNLHYLNLKERIVVVNDLFNGKIDVPSKIIHKYLMKQCKSLFLDLSTPEWESASMLPLEDFVLNRGNKKISYDKELVWEQISNESNRRFKAQLRR